MKDVDDRLFYQALTSKWTADKGSFITFFVIAIPYALLANKESVLHWVDAVALISTFALSFFVFGLTVWGLLGIRKYLTSRPLLAGETILITGIGGVLQGISSSLLMRPFGLVDALPMWVRIIDGTILGSIWLPIIALVRYNLLAYSAFKKNHVEELEHYANLTLLQSDLHNEIADEIATNAEAEVQDGLDALYREVELISLGMQNPHLAAQGIRETAEDHLRPLSHKYWKESSQLQRTDLPIKYQNLTPKGFLRNLWTALKFYHVDPLTFAIGCLAYSAPLTLRNHPNIGGILTVFWLFMGNLGLQSIGEFCAIKLHAFENTFRLSVTLFTILLPVSPLHPVISFLFPESVTPDFPVRVTLALETLAVAILLTAAKSAVLTKRSAKRAFTADVRWGEIQTDFETAVRSLQLRKWAHFVHGELKARFLAIAVLLDQAHFADDTMAKKRAIEAARDLLRQPVRPAEAQRHSLQEELNFRAELWDSVIPIQLKFDVQSQIPWPIVEQCGLVVEEAINNALQHGAAHGVDISVHELPDTSLEIIISNEGSAVGDHIPGIGSSIYDHATGGDWSLTTNAHNQTQLHLRIATTQPG